jgi:hydroxyacylglutathione hydrolase
MLFKRVESEGLAHYSYMIGDQHEALVIDPRRDCDIYVHAAVSQGVHITHICETHRNEDYAVGSVELSTLTNAQIWHADSQLDYSYGTPVKDGQTWQIGRLKVTAICTPGHTPGSVSYLLHDINGNPWIIFTGDTLFAGDVGRVDLPGIELIPEMAAQLYNSIFHRILTLDEGVIVCPGHGAGSVCGTMISDKPWTTIGLERKHNPKLQYTTKDEFIEQIGKEHERPPYFRKVEELNIAGAPILGAVPSPPPLSPEQFDEQRKNSVIVDTRMELGFSAAHVPGALSIWQDGLAHFAGWFVPYDKPILLMLEDDNPDPAVRTLLRLGYDRIAGYCAGGMLSWHMAGKESEQVETITVQDLCTLLDTDTNPWILDVRSQAEIVQTHALPDAHNIHITQLSAHLGQIPKNKKIFIFCGSGLRSMIGASILKQQGWQNIAVILGGITGWRSTTCPLE